MFSVPRLLLQKTLVAVDDHIKAYIALDEAPGRQEEL